MYVQALTLKMGQYENLNFIKIILYIYMFFALLFNIHTTYVCAVTYS